MQVEQMQGLRSMCLIGDVSESREKGIEELA